LKDLSEVDWACAGAGDGVAGAADVFEDRAGPGAAGVATGAAGAGVDGTAAGLAGAAFGYLIVRPVYVRPGNPVHTLAVMQTIKPFSSIL